MSELDDLGAYLAGAGHGALGTDIFLARIPDAPDLCTILQTYGTGMVERAMGGEFAAPVAVRPRVQVLTRALDPVAARARADSAMGLLDRLGPRVLGTTRYYGIEALQRPPFSLGWDKTGRWQYVFNIEVTKAPS